MEKQASGWMAVRAFLDLSIYLTISRKKPGLGCVFVNCGETTELNDHRRGRTMNRLVLNRIQSHV